MARTVFEKKMKVHFLTACANINAPTVAEINAGKNFTPFLKKDGVKQPDTQNNVDSATLDEDFDAQEVGSWGGNLELTMYRDDTSETNAWDSCVRGTRGFVVISPFGAAATIGRKVHVYPVVMHQPVPMQSAGNEMQTFKEVFAVTSQPAMSAVVA